ncbi:MAG: DNA-binding protein [Novosphingobium sp. 17-62-19]|nr:MAG: DNA-binding protein [Novosphingobium sp. 35-62-5]OZA20379.1 MAG: DNA-binding protein [Novosphingobium sp. 17-62-19]
MVDLRQIGDAPVVLVPDETERRRLAGRFAITAIDSMRAELFLTVDGQTVEAKGKLTASIVQMCAISGEDFPVKISEPVALRFVPSSAHHAHDEEIEINADDCDEIEYEGTVFDLGEAVAQSLALAIDPFAEGPDADKARAEHKLGGDVASGAFAALSALKKD